MMTEKSYIDYYKGLNDGQKNLVIGTAMENIALNTLKASAACAWYINLAASFSKKEPFELQVTDNLSKLEKKLRESGVGGDALEALSQIMPGEFIERHMPMHEFNERVRFLKLYDENPEFQEAANRYANMIGDAYVHSLTQGERGGMSRSYGQAEVIAISNRRSAVSNIQEKYGIDVRTVFMGLENREVPPRDYATMMLGSALRNPDKMI
ncbi:MAG: hypothetical protein HGA85_02940 [Nanoarchaeota archaeon]|nr:hypothetical protein [Nanoarchaeota archaeon]